MTVQVDEARDEPPRSAIDAFVPFGNAELALRADALDVAVLDQDQRIVDELAAFGTGHQRLLRDQRESTRIALGSRPFRRVRPAGVIGGMSARGIERALELQTFPRCALDRGSVLGRGILRHGVRGGRGIPRARRRKRGERAQRDDGRMP